MMDDLFRREMRVSALVAEHGRVAAKRMLTDERRRLTDIAAAVLEDEHQEVGYTYSGLCLVGLPHKKLADDAIWKRDGHTVRMAVEPGRTDGGGFIGVPYGARARVVMIYLMTQAVRSKSREIELGRSMNNWMVRMGIPVGGESAEAIRDQCRRIAACSLRFAWQGQGARGISHARIVSREMSFSAPRPERLWEDCVTLDADLFEALRRHPVPVAETAVRQLRDRSVSLDIYTWLSYRLHWLDKPIHVSWPALELQFGAGYTRPRAFRANFPAALAAAVAAYPDAKVALDETGATLHPSAPPIRKLA